MPAPAYGLTARQRDTLLVFQELMALDGIAPSYREIAAELEIAGMGEVVRRLRALRDKGYIDYLPFRSRSIVVLRPIPMPDEPEIELTPLGAMIAGPVPAFPDFRP